MTLIMLGRFILALAFIPAAGYPLALWLTGRLPRWSPAARWALAWTAGLGLTSLEMLSISLLDWQLNLPTVAVPIAAIALLLGAAYALRHKGPGLPGASAARQPLSRLEKALLAVLAFQILFNAVLALYIPLNTTDGWQNWGLKAKAFFLENELTFEYVSGHHHYYPLLVPLNLTWVYLGLGQVNDGWVKVIFTLNLLALAVLSYQFLRLVGFRRTGALLATVYLTTAGGMLVRHAAVAQADVPLGLFYGVACLSVAVWTRHPDELRYLAMAGLGAGLVAWTKYEGAVHAAILTAVASLYVIRNWSSGRFPPLLKMLAAYGLPIAFGLVPWIAFRYLNGIGVDGEHQGTLVLARLPIVLETVGRALLDVKRWGLLWPVLGLALAANWRRLGQPILYYPTLLLGLNLAFYLAAYLVTEHTNVAQQIIDTIHRLLLHILPLAVFVIAQCARLWLAEHQAGLSRARQPAAASAD